jgi:predicted acyltransferase
MVVHEARAMERLTPTDLVFPTFLFVVGVSIVFAYEARLAKGEPAPNSPGRRCAERRSSSASAWWSTAFPTFRWAPAHLRRPAAHRHLLPHRRALLPVGSQPGRAKIVVLVGAGRLLDPDALGACSGLGTPTHDIPFLDKDANLVAWLDRHIFPGRLYEGTRDPEGLLSDLPALGTALLGSAGRHLAAQQAHLRGKAAGLAGGAAACLAIGSALGHLVSAEQEALDKLLRAGRSGISLALLALLFWAIEVNGWRGKWTWPWLVLGSNAIAAYMISELLGSALDLIAAKFTASHSTQPAGSSICTGSHGSPMADWRPSPTPSPIWPSASSHLDLYRKKIFLKV